MANGVPRAMWEEDEGGVIGYMCKVDFECELGAASGGNVIYSSVEDLRSRRKCVDGCGIVEVRVYGVRVVQEENFDYEV